MGWREEGHGEEGDTVASMVKLGVNGKTRTHAETGEGRRGNDLSLKSGIRGSKHLPRTGMFHPSAGAGRRCGQAFLRLFS